MVIMPFMQRIYLDTCCLCRPFDVPNQSRIRLETDALDWILDQQQAGAIEWVSSAILLAEIHQIRNDEIRQIILLTTRAANAFVDAKSIHTDRAHHFRTFGLHAVDALHLVAAEAGKCDIMMTVDDRLLQAARRISDLKLRMINPVQFVAEQLP